MQTSEEEVRDDKEGRKCKDNVGDMVGKQVGAWPQGGLWGSLADWFGGRLCHWLAAFKAARNVWLTDQVSDQQACLLITAWQADTVLDGRKGWLAASGWLVGCLRIHYSSSECDDVGQAQFLPAGAADRQTGSTVSKALKLQPAAIQHRYTISRILIYCRFLTSTLCLNLGCKCSMLDVISVKKNPPTDWQKQKCF